MKTAAYVRRQPVLSRWGFCLGLYAVFGPAMWLAARIGRFPAVMRKMGQRQKEELEKRNLLKTYVPGKQDVFVAVYPKSGTNWCMQIALQLIYHGEAEFDHIHYLVPWPDPMPPFMNGYAIPLELAGDWKTAPEKKRVIKTHLNWDQLPHSDDARYIMVIRDPKDTFVSMYHFMKAVAFGPFMPPVDQFHKTFLSGGGMFGGWAENAAGYWAQRHRPNVLVLSFKQMKRDLRGTVQKIAQFLDIRVGEDVIDKVCEKASFDYMKRNDEKFRAWTIAPWRPDPVMVRSGKQGGASELLSAAQQREIDEFSMAELERIGSDLPYEEFCDLTEGTQRPPQNVAKRAESALS